MSGSGFGGISVIGRTGVTVTRCLVSGSTNGINVFQTAGVTLSGNTASGNENGLVVGASTAATVLANIATGNSVDGFNLNNGNQGADLTGNLSRSNGNQGYSAYGAGSNNVCPTRNPRNYPFSPLPDRDRHPPSNVWGVGYKLVE